MKKINKNTKTILIWSVIISLMLVVGIPMIILGAIKSIWFVLVIGIIFTVIGFYGTPIIWVYFANTKVLQRVVEIINNEHLLKVSEIAQHLQLSEQQIKMHITNAIKKNFLQGYIFDGLELKENKEEKNKFEKLLKNKCPNCGANLIKIDNGNKCEYCGSEFLE